MVKKKSIAIIMAIFFIYIYTSESNYIDDSYPGKVEKILIAEMDAIRKKSERLFKNFL